MQISKRQAIKFHWLVFVIAMFFNAQGYAQAINPDTGWQFFQSKDLPSLQAISNHKPWQIAKVPSLLKVNPANGLYGTYRTIFDVASSRSSSSIAQSLYIEGVRNNDRTYLNGVLIGQTGSFAKNWKLILDNPNNLPRIYSIPNGLLRPANNELIVQVQLGFGEAFGAMLPGGVGISGYVKVLEEPVASQQYNQALTNEQIIDSAIILLGFVDLALIILLFKATFHKFPEFMWLLLGSGLLFCGGLLLDIGYLRGTTNDITKSILILSILFTPLVNAVFFNAQQHLASPAFLWLAASLIVICAILLFVPYVSSGVKATAWIVWATFTGLLFLFALVCAGLNVKQQRAGGFAMLFGLCVYLFTIRTQWLPFDGFYNRNLVIGSLIFRYALIWAYFLKIQEMSRGYRNLSTQMLSTLEENKKSVARDIHDELGQHLSSAKLQLQLSEKSDSEQHNILLKQELQNAMSSMRRIIDGLHPAVLDKHTLGEAIEIEAKRLKNLHQVLIQSNVTEKLFPSAMNTHIYRIIQELLGNAIKHGKASKVFINISQREGLILIAVTDNGVGIKKNKKSNQTGGFGQVSLAERVQLLGGNVHYERPHNKQGTSLQITLPLIRN